MVIGILAFFSNLPATVYVLESTSSCTEYSVQALELRSLERRAECAFLHFIWNWNPISNHDLYEAF